MKIATFLLLLLSMTIQCEGHGRLVEPPQRSSLWRFGFDAPVNTDDHSLDCGGMGVMYSKINQGRCGVCGDRFDSKQPRDNEAGGKYGQGIIARHYREGQTIGVVLEVTVDHGGWSEFRICPNNNIKKIVTQDCLDKYQLKITGSGKRFYHPKKAGNILVSVELPPGLTCSQCVFQWRWKTDSSNHCNPITKENCCVGCGVQEEFVNCADVSIASSTSGQNFNQSASPNPLLPDQFLQIAAILLETPMTDVKDVSKIDGYVPIDLTERKYRLAMCQATSIWKRALGTYLANMWCLVYCDEKKCPLNLCEANCQK